MSYPVITNTGLTLQAPEDPPSPDELSHPDYLDAAGGQAWDHWDFPDWDCRFLRHLATGLLYHDEDLYLIGWFDPQTGSIDLFDAPMDE